MRRPDRLRLALAVLEGGLFGPLCGAAVFVALTFLKRAWGGGWSGGLDGVRDALAVLSGAWPAPAAVLAGMATLGVVIHGVLYALHLRRGLPYAVVGVLVAVAAGWPWLSDIFLEGSIGHFLADARAEAILATGFASGVLFWRRRRPDLDPL